MAVEEMNALRKTYKRVVKSRVSGEMNRWVSRYFGIYGASFWTLYGCSRLLTILAGSSIAIDGSEFEAVNNRDQNFNKAKPERRRRQIEETLARYLWQLATAHRQEPSDGLADQANRLGDKIARLEEEMIRPNPGHS